MVDQWKEKPKLTWHCLLINRNKMLSELSNELLFFRIKNKKMGQKIWILVIG